jgi:CheY-like chemotaxis protein
MNDVNRPPCIAIVDDEKDLVDVYLRLFRLKKINVCFVAANGLEAVELYRKAPVKPDIVIMDNRMPVMNGIDAMKVIETIDGSAKFIFLTADIGVRDEAICLGALFIKKPASLNELLKAIETLSGKPGSLPSGGCGSSGGHVRKASWL